MLAIFLFLIFANESRVAAKPNFNNFEFESFAFKWSADSDERAILDLINEERRKRRLNALMWDNKLGQLARSYSRKMARENFFSHYDSKGNNLENRARDFKITWTSIGENLYFCKGFDNPAEAAVEGWLKSPSHRANMLGRNWSATGIGLAETRDGRVYVTQIFLRR